jgi:hypothetical protein
MKLKNLLFWHKIRLKYIVFYFIYESGTITIGTCNVFLQRFMCQKIEEVRNFITPGKNVSITNYKFIGFGIPKEAKK